MSLETAVRITEFSGADPVVRITDEWRQASYTKTAHFKSFDLTGGVKTEIKSNLATIKYVYVKVTGSATTVYVSKQLSPENFAFTGFFHVVDTNGITSISLKSEDDTTVEIYLGGS